MFNIQVCLFLFLGLIFIIYFNDFTVQEYFSNNLNLIFLGDSIFKNDTYVSDNKSVGDLLYDTYGKDTVKIYAKDGATINDVTQQIYLIKPKKYNNNQTHIFVSMGGNNIIEEYIENISDITLEKLFQYYKNQISRLKKRLPKAKIYLVTIYYPMDIPYYFYYGIIKSWNNKVINYGKKENLSVMRLDKFFKSAGDFTYSIEPSVKGSQIILTQVNNLVYKK